MAHGCGVASRASRQLWVGLEHGAVCNPCRPFVNLIRDSLLTGSSFSSVADESQMIWDHIKSMNLSQIKE